MSTNLHSVSTCPLYRPVLVVFINIVFLFVQKGQPCFSTCILSLSSSSFFTIQVFASIQNVCKETLQMDVKVIGMLASSQDNILWTIQGLLAFVPSFSLKTKFKRQLYAIITCFLCLLRNGTKHTYPLCHWHWFVIYVFICLYCHACVLLSRIIFIILGRKINFP